jgi:hypothetical protein
MTCALRSGRCVQTCHRSAYVRNDFDQECVRATVQIGMTNGTCYERVEMADGVIRMCLCTWERPRGGDLRITGIVRVI